MYFCGAIYFSFSSIFFRYLFFSAFFSSFAPFCVKGPEDAGGRRFSWGMLISVRIQEKLCAAISRAFPVCVSGVSKISGNPGCFLRSTDRPPPVFVQVSLIIFDTMRFFNSYDGKRYFIFSFHFSIDFLSLRVTIILITLLEVY